MIDEPTIASSRAQLLEQLLPREVPVLWCPLLTHYNADGALDRPRIAAHLRHLSPHVNAFLIAGSTGDGWEMTSDEIRQLFDVAVTEAQRLKLYLLLGALQTDALAARDTMRETMAWVQSRTLEGDTV